VASPLTTSQASRRHNLVATVVMVFAVYTGFAFVLPFLPLFVGALGVEETEMQALWAGALIAVSPLIAGGLSPWWGRLADRRGHKAVAALALVAYVVLLALHASVRNVGELLALRVGVGIFGGLGPIGLAMAAAQAPREDAGRPVGLVQAAQILAAAVGPLAGGLLADAIGFRRTFLAAAALCAVALVLLVVVYRDDVRSPETAAHGAGGGLGLVLRFPGVLGLLAVLFTVNFVWRSFTPILPLQIRELGESTEHLATATGILIAAYSVAAAASATLLGRASRTRSPRRLLLATLLGAAPVVMAMALAPSFRVLVTLGVVGGLVSGGSLTLCYTMGGLKVPESVRTTAFGFFAGAALFGGAVAPFAAGLLAHVSLRAIYWADGVILVGLAAVVAGQEARATRAAERSEPSPESTG